MPSRCCRFPSRLRHVDRLLRLLRGRARHDLGCSASRRSCFPALVPAVPAENMPPALALLAAGLALYGAVALRAFRTFLLTRRWLDLAVVTGLAWLATALVPALTMGWYDLGWWIGHELELDRNPRRRHRSRDRPQPARSSPGRWRATWRRSSWWRRRISSSARTCARSQAGSPRRTSTQSSTAAGSRCSPSRSASGSDCHAAASATLAVEALVHDIGKLSVPDAILKKPSELDDEEYALVKRHPDSGYELLARIGGFSPGVRRLVREHHERARRRRLSAGAQRRELSLDTRILSVCDVYDALITTRVYRPPWTHEQAIRPPPRTVRLGVRRALYRRARRVDRCAAHGRAVFDDAPPGRDRRALLAGRGANRPRAVSSVFPELSRCSTRPRC